MIGLALITLHLSLITSSCTQDAYDKGEGRYSQMVAEMADGYTASDGRVTTFVTDADEHLTVTEPFTTKLMPKADTVYRAVFYYNKVEQGAEVIGLDRVGVITPRTIDTLKTDPVRLESMWMAKSGRYLNLSVYLMLGSTDDDEAIQKIGCHRDTLTANPDGTSTLHLRLYHDQAGVPQYYSARTRLSIPLSEIDADSVVLTVNTYDGPVSKVFNIGVKPRNDSRHEATLTDASTLYRVCSSRPQRLIPSHGSKTERTVHPSGCVRRHIVKPLQSVYDSRRRLETAPFCLSASCLYYVIALRHIIR